MTEDSGDATPDDSSDQDSDEAPEAEAAVDGNDPFSSATSRRQAREALKDVMANGRTSFLTADEIDPAVVIFDGEGITSTGGNPSVVGKFMVALEGFLGPMGAAVKLTDLGFENSVTFTLEPIIGANEQELIDTAIAASEAKRESDPHGTSNPSEKEIAKLIPSSVVNLEAATRLLQLPSTRIAGGARTFSSGAADGLRRLSEVIANDQATMRITSPTKDRAEVGRRRAERFAHNLREVEPIDTEVLTIFGTLTRTDSDAKQFRVVLDRSRIPPSLGVRRQVVEGPYTEEASQHVKEEGLWDAYVRAEVETRFEAPAGGGRTRATAFTFLRVREATPPAR